MENTKNVLEWAANYSKENDVVKMFWDQLCHTLGMSASSTGSEILDEVRAYGGNTFANWFRGDGVPYVEVAYEVADALRPTLTWARDYKKGDLVSIEKYVLKQMEISDDDVNQILKGTKMATDAKIRKKILKEDVPKIATALISNTLGNTLGKKLASKAAEAVLKKAAEAAAKKAAKKAAAAAAKKAARKAAEEAAKQVAKQVLIRLMAAINIALVVWTVVDIAGPAMRKTIPSVTYIALLRQLHKNVKSNIH
jgi:uncharacterized protein YaaW (UPF0174 family)